MSFQVLLNQLRAVFDQIIELQNAQDAMYRAALEELQRRLQFEEKKKQREIEVWFETHAFAVGPVTMGGSNSFSAESPRTLRWPVVYSRSGEVLTAVKLSDVPVSKLDAACTVISRVSLVLCH